jgi:hypothetical protein
MTDYLKNLDEKIKEKGLRSFCVFPDLKTFKIIKKNQDQMVKLMKKNPEKYAGRHLAKISLDVNFKALKHNGDVFTMIIRISKIDNDGEIEGFGSDSWRLFLKYRQDDIEQHPFKIKNLQKLIDWTYNKKTITHSLFGMYYDELEKDLKRLQKVYKKIDYTLD